MEFTAAAIAGFLKGEIEGNPDIKVNTVAKIEEGHEGALSFLANPKYEHYIYSTGSSIVIIFLSDVFNLLIKEYNVVDLPLPVGPVTRIIP